MKEQKRGQSMETNFPHLTNGMAKATPTRRHRTRTMRRMLLSVGIFCAVIASIGYALAHDGEHDEKSLDDAHYEVCFHLREAVILHADAVARFEGQELIFKLSELKKSLESLSNSYRNICK